MNVRVQVNIAPSFDLPELFPVDGFLVWFLTCEGLFHEFFRCKMHPDAQQAD